MVFSYFVSATCVFKGICAKWACVLDIIVDAITSQNWTEYVSTLVAERRTKKPEGERLLFLPVDEDWAAGANFNLVVYFLMH